MEVEEYNGPWVCFNCGEHCETREQAKEHFGEYEEAPICESIKELWNAQNLRELVLQSRELWERIRVTNDRNERLEFENSNWNYVARKLTGKPSAHTSDLEMWYDSAQGRVIAAEAAMKAAPRWLARWLRRRAERMEL